MNSVDRRARPLATAVLSFLAFLVFLGGDSLQYVVRTEGSDIVIDAFGNELRAPAFAAGSPLRVQLRPQERYASRQVLAPNRGVVRNGLVMLRALLTPWTRNPDRFAEFPQTDGRSASYVHMNPFRASFVVRQADRELRLEVNVPDNSIELWRDNQKIQTISLKTPLLRLLFFPVLASLAAALCLASILAAAGVRDPVSPEGGGERAPPRASPLALAFLFVAGFVATVLFSSKVSHHLPGFGDEMNYLFQAKIFASGRLSVPEPPDPEFFKVDWMHLFGNDHKVWGFHPPGNCFFLAIGWLVGNYWITLPIVFGLILCVQYLLAIEVLGDRRVALLSAALVGTSHYVLSLASSFMAHAPSLLLSSLFYLCVLRFLRTGSPRTLVFAAGWLGLAFVVRPLSAVLVGLPPLFLVAGRFERRLLGAYAAATIVGVALGSVVFWYTWGITGRFTFSYNIKGMEVGQTLWVRLSKGWQYHFSNLFRNINEFQHRVHSFGFVLNVVLFFVPFFALQEGRKRRLVLFMAWSFVFYVIAHSFLHWYGWKWEPRMISDVSFLFFLVSTAGLTFVAGQHGARLAAVTVSVVAALVWVALYDIPARATSEYANYNHSPSSLSRILATTKLSDAVIFLAAEQAYAVYMPMNSVDFDGPIVFARFQGNAYNYKLLTRFPNRRAFLSNDGERLSPLPNFYHSDVKTLAASLQPYTNDEISIVLPWMSVAGSKLNDMLPGAKMSPGDFLTSLARSAPADGRRRVVAFVEDATELATLVDLLYTTEIPEVVPSEGPIALRVLLTPREGRKGVPGFWMTCTEGTRWNGRVLHSGLVSSLDLAPCVGENRSIVWDARFELQAASTFTMSLQSDDGAAVFIDDVLVIDNDLENTHGAQIRNAQVTLAPGTHKIRVKFFNGPGEEKLEVQLDDGVDGAKPLSVAAFMARFHFYVDSLPGGSP